MLSAEDILGADHSHNSFSRTKRLHASCINSRWDRSVKCDGLDQLMRLEMRP